MNKQAAAQTIIGTNVTAVVEGNTLILRVDLSQNHGPTGTGKNQKIASTGGNVFIPGTTAKLGLNVFTKAAA